ncbi:MAG: hypothetical protein EPO51_04655 [Phenylobacterium sp.]|uniref:enoyl-CoA hydratase-related protein n=1 Tax=Phenylobacterium sp. TaxID=1871053 RepID=UPI001229F050|nr:enoyl-CoA hydratase-related protein [Phenylobacterium sp.]TAJ73763.1 MAG: hypothetical protein EPO51_04655 [Phenylobacterium sp.]
MAKVRVASDGAVREVTLARGEKRNALDADMLASLTEAFTGPPAARERVTVIRAEGPVFCAGLDLRGTPRRRDWLVGHRDDAPRNRTLPCAGGGRGPGRRHRRRQ